MAEIIWWAAPADPGRWFSTERIADSRAYHAPLATAALLRGAARLGGLLLLGAFARSWFPEPGTPVDALVIGAATGLVIAFVNSATDGWMEYRHEPRFGSVPVSRDRFVRVSTASAVIAVALGALAALGLHLLAGATVWWPVPTVILLVALSATVGPASTRLVHRHTALEPEIQSDLDVVAGSVGVNDVEWGRLVQSSEAGLNALTLGFDGSRRILLTSELLEADPELRDFVVAHEAAHLRRRHHRVSFLVSSCGTGLEVACLWLIDLVFLRSVGWSVVEPTAWPFVVAIIGVVSIPVGVVEAWFSRAQERRADADAAVAVGALGAASLRALHDHGRSDLDPGWLARCWSPHPTPAERLARAEHLARSQGSSPTRPS